MTAEMYGVKLGAVFRFRKTVSESDVYLFAGITGDFYENHVDAEVMGATAYGQRVAHGALLVGFMSTPSALMLKQSGRNGVSYGYDRMRFLRPVFFGDTIQVDYQTVELMPEAGKVRSEVTVTNQHGEKVAVAQHIVYFMEHNEHSRDS